MRRKSGHSEPTCGVIGTMSGFKDWNANIVEEFRANGGDVTTGGFGRHLVLLHHTGAKSGTQRVTPLMGLRTDDDTWLIAASKKGAPDNPDWYHNLKAHPDVVIETPDDGTVEVRADILRGTARDDGWARFTTASPGFRDYEARTPRVIPVIALRRR